MKRTMIVALATAGLAGQLVGAGAAHAAGGDVRTTRACSEASTVKLKAKPDDGRLEVEAEVDSNVNGEVWAWRLRHNGSRAGHGTKQTSAPSGSFRVVRRVDNAAGTDTVRFRGTHAGEVCVVSLSI